MRKINSFFIFIVLLIILITNIGLADNSVTVYPDIGIIQGIATDGNYIWCNCDLTGVVKLDRRDGSYIRFTEPPELTTSIQMRGPIAVDNEGNLWVSRNLKLMMYDGNEWALHQSELYSQRFWFDSTGLLWIANIGVTQTHEGNLSSYDGTTLAKYKNTKVSGITVAIDSKDVKWVAYYKEGIASFDGKVWTQYTTEDGLVNDNVRDIYISTQMMFYG